MSHQPTQPLLETEGNSVSLRFQPSKARTISNLQAAIDGFCHARQLSRDYVAEVLCGMSPANFSKVSNGQQGDFVLFVNEKLPAPIREDFEERERRDRTHDPMLAAAEQMVMAAFTVLRLSGSKLPLRMLHAELAEPARERQKLA